MFGDLNAEDFDCLSACSFEGACKKQLLHSNRLDRAHFLNSLNSNATKGETSQLVNARSPFLFRQRLNYQSDGDVAVP